MELAQNLVSNKARGDGYLLTTSLGMSGARVTKMKVYTTSNY